MNPITPDEIARRKTLIEQLLLEGYAPPGHPRGSARGSVLREAAKRLGMSPGAIFNILPRLGIDWNMFATPQPAIPAPLPEQSARAEVQRLKDTISSLQTQLRDADRDHLDERAVREKILGLASYEPAPPSWLIATPKNASGNAGIPSTIWSDWHLGETVSLAETNGVNQFNFEIADQRIKKLVGNTIDLCFNHMTGAKYPGIVVNLLGDIISGAIHPELAETDEDDIFPTILWALNRIIWGLTTFADRFGRVFVACAPGNHGRVLDKKPYNKRYVYRNADWLIYQLLERHFKAVKDDRITFDIPATGEALYRVYDHRYMGVHGDDLGVRGGDGIIGAIGPIMRGEIKMRTSSAQIGRDYDTLLMGHWHQNLILPRAIVNNCLKGYDEYARRSLRAVPTPPQQMLFFTHAKYGITAYWSVQVGEKTSTSEQPWVSLPKR